MRFVLLIVTVILLAGCKKDIQEHSLSITGENISSDALAPLKCHTLTMSSFRMKKTQYSDTRIKTLFMETDPFLNTYYTYNYRFVYAPNKAKLIGTLIQQEYDDESDQYRRDTLEVNFNSFGYATSMYAISPKNKRTLLLTLSYNTSNPKLVTLSKVNGITVFNDAKGNITQMRLPNTSRVFYTYDLNSPAGIKHFYPPATVPVYRNRFTLGEYYPLLEVLQWVPMPRNARTSVTIRDAQTYEFAGKQTYSNHKYDAAGNLISFNFKPVDYNFPNDLGLEKITWHCR